MTKRISPLSALTIDQQKAIFQLFADQISDSAISGRLQEYGLNLSPAEVGMERTVWRGNLAFFQEAMESVAQHRAMYPDSCDQPIVAVASEIMAATSLLLAKRLHARCVLALATEDNDQDLILMVELLNRLAEGNAKIARGRAVVQKYAVELPLKMPSQVETKDGITSDFVTEVDRMLRLMPG